jgi:D-alanyl-D-alanine carboxypeptidase
MKRPIYPKRPKSPINIRQQSSINNKRKFGLNNRVQSPLYTRLKSPINKKPKKRTYVWFIIFALITIIILTQCVSKTSIEKVELKSTPITKIDSICSNNDQNNDAYLQTENIKIKWPKRGNSAVGTLCNGKYWTSGDSSKMQSIASITKTISSLVILQEKPLSAPKSAKRIYISKKWASYYQKENLQAGASVLLKVHTYVSEDELIKMAMLLSANNAVNILAEWAFGSMANYKAHAEQYLKNSGLDHTVIGNDASGRDNKTRSSVGDLFKIGMLAMQNPELKKIVAMKTAKGHVNGKIVPYSNIDKLIFYKNFIGIKTGYTKKAGACLLFAKKYKHNIIIGVVTRQKSAGDRVLAAYHLANSFQKLL